MDYRQFVAAVAAQDERNTFTTTPSTGIQDLPVALRSFYDIYDPVDVEIVLDDLTSIKLVALNELSDLQEDYAPSDGSFIFATHEGDPIACKEGTIITWSHGSRHIIVEKLADSFEQWLQKLLENLKK